MQYCISFFIMSLLIDNEVFYLMYIRSNNDIRLFVLSKQVILPIRLSMGNIEEWAVVV